MVLGGTGPVLGGNCGYLVVLGQGGAGWFVVVLGHCGAVLVGTWWYWVSIGRYWLVLGGNGLVWGRTGWFLVVMGQCRVVLVDI